MDFNEIDKTFEYYEKRYNLSKMAGDCGISLKNFSNLNSKEKFLTLSQRLKESNKVNLASFFYGKLFEVSGDIEALINKTDCLIRLNEFEEAIRYNNIGWELYLEDPDIDSARIERELAYQKALIMFYTEKYRSTESICEEAIIKFKTEEFYYLLCADLIIMDNIINAKKLFNKYSNKFGSLKKFLLEVIVLLLDINQIEKAIEFTQINFDINEKQKKNILNQINKYLNFNKNKYVLKKFFEKDLNFLKK